MDDKNTFLVFISHQYEDAPLAKAWEDLLDDLGRTEIQAWAASSLEHGIEPGGKEWRNQIFETLDKANCIIVIVTEDVCTNSWVMWECGMAFGCKKHANIIPIRFSVAPDQVTGPLTAIQSYNGKIEKEVKKIAFELCERAQVANPSEHIWESIYTRYLNSINDYCRLLENKNKPTLPTFSKLTVAARQLASDLDRIENSIGGRIFVVRRMPFEFTNKSWEFLALDNVPTASNRDFKTAMAGYIRVMKKVILQGGDDIELGGNDYWDWTIMGRIDNLSVNEETANVLTDWYFPSSQSGDSDSAVNTSGLGLYNGEMSDGLFLIGEVKTGFFSNTSEDLESLFDGVRWHIGYRFRFGKPISGKWGDKHECLRTEDPHQIRRFASMFAAWWIDILPQVHDSQEPPPDIASHPQPLKIDIDDVSPSFAQDWRRFILQWFKAE